MNVLRSLLPSTSLSAVLILFLTGCTETAKMKVTPTAFTMPAGQTASPRTAALVIDQALLSHQCEMHLIGGTRVFPLGTPMAQNLRDTARQLFSEVKEFESEAAALNQADVILIPRMGRSSFTGPIPFKALLRTEWTVKDRAGQQVLWLTSLDGTSEVRPGFGATRKAERKAWQDAFDDLARKTVEAFQAAPEMAAYRSR